MVAAVSERALSLRPRSRRKRLPLSSTARRVGLSLSRSIAELGAWWSGECEIDVIAVDDRNRITLAGSCKWTNEAADVREYAALQRALTLSGLPAEDPHLALFCRSGFTDRLRALAAAQDPPRLLLVDPEAMYRA